LGNIFRLRSWTILSEAFPNGRASRWRSRDGDGDRLDRFGGTLTPATLAVVLEAESKQAADKSKRGQP